jgi:hypothetical protein
MPPNHSSGVSSDTNSQNVSDWNKTLDIFTKHGLRDLEVGQRGCYQHLLFFYHLEGWYHSSWSLDPGVRITNCQM